jgi:small subunit ribosomal protein S11
MGKKKVTTQSGEQAIAQGSKQEGAVAKASSSRRGRRVENGRVYVNATYNNTVVTVTDEKGDVLAWASAGSIGFSGPKKATPFAASKIVSVVAEKLKNYGLQNLDVYIKGVGGGRDSAVRSFANQGFNLVSVKDVTPVPHNGPKAKKVRRV